MGNTLFPNFALKKLITDWLSKQQNQQALEVGGAIPAPAVATATAVAAIPRPIPNPSIVIPEIARGHEEFYLRFLNGILIYQKGTPNEVRLRIADLANPLDGTFDLSRCGDAGRYLSIATGYKKAKKTSAQQHNRNFFNTLVFGQKRSTVSTYYWCLERPICAAWNLLDMGWERSVHQ